MSYPMLGSRNVTQRLIDVFGLKVRIVAQDSFARFADRKQTQQPRDRKPEAANARLAGADRGIECDAFKRHYGRIAEDRAASYCPSFP